MYTDIIKAETVDLDHEDDPPPSRAQSVHLRAIVPMPALSLDEYIPNEIMGDKCQPISRAADDRVSLM